ncbi:acyltransferase family protein [Mucilaginibacter lacusdianchii]|uniref:acyltransferase family protein n=1 Tax=Mucilaginibacter lacusdianchii TaxID=2684211 RepID=UPI00131DE87F|nr:acyltransferase [Mucilaginibacter sp. JXJ CY 39]
MHQKATLAYIPALDGMRGLSILLVFIAHLGFDRIVPGGLGVTLFFFISGYIITLVLNNEYKKNTSINLKHFYTGRILRLYPPLLFMLILTAFYLIYISYSFKLGEILACLLYYENYYFFYGGKGHLTLTILWSLAVEEHFYLLYPLLFLGFFKNTKKIIGIFLGLMLLALVVRIGGYIQYKHFADELERYCYVLTHTRFDSILFGCMAAVLLTSKKSDNYKSLLSNKKLLVFAFLVQVFCLVIRDPMFRYTVRYTLQGLSFFILVPAIINTDSYPIIRQALSNKALVSIGKVSYSIYLLHMLVVKSLAFIQANGHTYLYFACCIAGTSLLSVFCYYVIERPIYRFRKGLNTKRLLLQPQPVANGVTDII